MSRSVLVTQGTIRVDWLVTASPSPARSRTMSFTRQIMRLGYTSLAAQISFYFLLSIFPGLLLVSAVLTLLPKCADYYFEIRSLVESVLPAVAAGLLKGSATGAHICQTRAGGAISLSLVILLLSGSNVFVVVMRSMNGAYGIEESRPLWRRRVLAVVFLLGGVVAFVSIFPVLVLGEFVGSAISSIFELDPQFVRLWSSALVPAAALLGGVGLACLYRFGPAWKVRWRSAGSGAVVATFGLLVASLGFRTFVFMFSRFERVYGAITAVIVLLIWMYFASLIVLLGGSLVAHRERASSSAGDKRLQTQ